MTIAYRKYKTAVIEFGGTTPDYSFQVTTAQVINNTPDGDRVFTFAADGSGEFRETPDDAWQLALKWVSDWTTSTGFNSYINAHDGQTLAITVHYDNGDSTGFGRTWSGNVVIKQPTDGGDVRTMESSEATWNFIGKPTFAQAS